MRVVNTILCQLIIPFIVQFIIKVLGFDLSRWKYKKAYLDDVLFIASCYLITE